MKTRKVEIEIPEDMEVVQSIHRNIITDVMVLLMQKRKPRRWIFEEIIGRKYVNEGEYWRDSSGNISQALYGSYDLAEGQLALRKIGE